MTEEEAGNLKTEEVSQQSKEVKVEKAQTEGPTGMTETGVETEVIQEKDSGKANHMKSLGMTGIETTEEKEHYPEKGEIPEKEDTPEREKTTEIGIEMTGETATIGTMEQQTSEQKATKDQATKILIEIEKETIPTTGTNQNQTTTEEEKNQETAREIEMSQETDNGAETFQNQGKKVEATQDTDKEAEMNPETGKEGEMEQDTGVKAGTLTEKLCPCTKEI